MTAVILRWMVLLDKNDGQLLRHDDERRRISINDMDLWDDVITTLSLERCAKRSSPGPFKSRVYTQLVKKYLTWISDLRAGQTCDFGASEVREEQIL